jgi:RNA polymerase sigma-B factor
MTTSKCRQDIDYDRLAPLFRELADPRAPDDRRRQLRAVLVIGHLPLATAIARRFRNRGQQIDDLEQVARVGLINAIDRFDPYRGCTFLAFAVPTMTGEVRRYFRDLTWSVTLPRKLQERHYAIAVAAEDLARELRAEPRPQQIADRLGIPVQDVYEGLQAGLAHHAAPLDVTGSRGAGQEASAMACGVPDPGLELVENLETLHRALADLPDRATEILVLRFFDDLTQTQIAHRVGLSQMQVSRILSDNLARLRRAFFDMPA